MITIPKKVEYSILLISYLAKNKGKTISIAQASKQLMLPYRFLGQITNALKSDGIVESKEGKSGGYVLSLNWQDKTMYDLIAALGENKHMVECLSAGSCALTGQCSMQKIWSRVEKSFINELKMIKLKEV